jgi:heme exporter protein C
MLTAMLLMTFAAWAYASAVALHRVRSIMIEREAHNDWVADLRRAEGPK